MEPSDRDVPPDSERPGTTSRRRGTAHSKPTPYRKEGGFANKKQDGKWKKVVKYEEPPAKAIEVPKPSTGRVYAKELIWRVAQDPESQAQCSVALVFMKREIKKVPGAKTKHRAKHVQPKWCADVRQKSDPLTRSIKSLLNKLAPTNYAAILSKTQGLLNAEAALAVAVHIFDKASAESKYSELYARLCEDLIVSFPEFKAYLVTT